MENQELKSFTLTKAEPVEGKKELAIEGYASVFGNIDCYDDIVEKGAFAESLQKEGNRVCLCYNHDTDDVIGRIDDLYEDEKGLFFKATILPTKLGEDIMTLIEGGALKDLSFMYRVHDYVMERTEDREIRHIKKASLYEISVVWRGANDRAKIEDFARKSFELIQESVADLSDEDLESLRKSVGCEQAKRIINRLKL